MTVSHRGGLAGLGGLAGSGSSGIGEALDQRLKVVARTERLLVATDFDGTLSPLVDDRDAALPDPRAVLALRRLTESANTVGAIVSGRPMADLAARARMPVEVVLIGSHGAEFEEGLRLDESQRSRRAELIEECSLIVATVPGAEVEEKPAGVAVHVRRAGRQHRAGVLRQVRQGPARMPGVHALEGKDVVDLSVSGSDKGAALERLRFRSASTAVVFIGDDRTDESVFRRLRGPDVSIKVGPGVTTAAHRVPDTVAVAEVLGRLADLREEWIQGSPPCAIQDLSLLSDGDHLALVTPAGSIAWMCVPRPDGHALFGRLLGGPDVGEFAINPLVGGTLLGHGYVPGTMTIRTHWTGLSVTDFLEVSPEDSRWTVLMRHLVGTVPTMISLSPRPSFGLVPAHIEPAPGGLVITAGAEQLSLRAPGVSWTITTEGEQPVARAVVTPREGLDLELRSGTQNLRDEPISLSSRRGRTEAHWRDWAAGLSLPVHHREAVTRSALTLRALCNRSTGAILAAATTSLPEDVGGVRNWDYRYCWIRDGAIMASALAALGSTHEAEMFLAWVRRVLRTDDIANLRPMYGLHGEHVPIEAALHGMPGYRGSRPVRVGNAAAEQIQLDVFGPLVALIHQLAEIRGVTADDILLSRDAVAAVAKRWHEPDHGIWEIRHQPRHHVHSKVMCWLTVDRAIAIGEMRGSVHAEWHELRQAIADDIREHAWSSKLGGYQAAYELEEPDAAVLWLINSGFEDPGSERARKTVSMIEAELREGPTVMRYRYDDGLPGSEGGMIVCALWLVEAYARVGRRADAVELLEEILSTRGRSGLLPEQWDPASGTGLGNHPQGYSHAGLITAALLLEG